MSGNRKAGAKLPTVEDDNFSSSDEEYRNRTSRKQPSRESDDNFSSDDEEYKYYASRKQPSRESEDNPSSDDEESQYHASRKQPMRELTNSELHLSEDDEDDDEDDDDLSRDDSGDDNDSLGQDSLGQDSSKAEDEDELTGETKKPVGRPRKSMKVPRTGCDQRYYEKKMKKELQARLVLCETEKERNVLLKEYKERRDARLARRAMTQEQKEYKKPGDARRAMTQEQMELEKECKDNALKANLDGYLDGYQMFQKENNKAIDLYRKNQTKLIQQKYRIDRSPQTKPKPIKKAKTVSKAVRKNTALAKNNSARKTNTSKKITASIQSNIPLTFAMMPRSMTKDVILAIDKQIADTSGGSKQWVVRLRESVNEYLQGWFQRHSGAKKCQVHIVGYARHNIAVGTDEDSPSVPVPRLVVYLSEGNYASPENIIHGDERRPFGTSLKWLSLIQETRLSVKILDNKSRSTTRSRMTASEDNSISLTEGCLDFEDLPEGTECIIVYPRNKCIAEFLHNEANHFIGEKRADAVFPRTKKPAEKLTAKSSATKKRAIKTSTGMTKTGAVKTSAVSAVKTSTATKSSAKTSAANTAKSSSSPCASTSAAKTSAANTAKSSASAGASSSAANCECCSDDDDDEDDNQLPVLDSDGDIAEEEQIVADGNLNPEDPNPSVRRDSILFDRPDEEQENEDDRNLSIVDSSRDEDDGDEEEVVEAEAAIVSEEVVEAEAAIVSEEVVEAEAAVVSEEVVEEEELVAKEKEAENEKEEATSIAEADDVLEKYDVSVDCNALDEKADTNLPILDSSNKEEATASIRNRKRLLSTVTNFEPQSKKSRLHSIHSDPLTRTGKNARVKMALGENVAPVENGTSDNCQVEINYFTRRHMQPPTLEFNWMTQPMASFGSASTFKFKSYEDHVREHGAGVNIFGMVGTKNREENSKENTASEVEEDAGVTHADGNTEDTNEMAASVDVPVPSPFLRHDVRPSQEEETDENVDPSTRTEVIGVIEKTASKVDDNADDIAVSPEEQNADEKADLDEETSKDVACSPSEVTRLLLAPRTNQARAINDKRDSNEVGGEDVGSGCEGRDSDEVDAKSSTAYTRALLRAQKQLAASKNDCPSPTSFFHEGAQSICDTKLGAESGSPATVDTAGTGTTKWRNVQAAMSTQTATKTQTAVSAASTMQAPAIMQTAVSATSKHASASPHAATSAQTALKTQARAKKQTSVLARASPQTATKTESALKMQTTPKTPVSGTARRVRFSEQPIVELHEYQPHPEEYPGKGELEANVAAAKKESEEQEKLAESLGLHLYPKTRFWGHVALLDDIEWKKLGLPDLEAQPHNLSQQYPSSYSLSAETLSLPITRAHIGRNGKLP